MGASSFSCSLAILGAIVSSPSAFCALVVFGDSLSDNGSGAGPVVRAALSNATIDTGVYPVAPYYQGHFSNGPVWIEVAASALGQELQDFATGNAASGATASAVTIIPPYGYTSSQVIIPVPSAYQQAMSYVALHGSSVNPDNTYIIWIGANDILSLATGRAPGSLSDVVLYINMTMSALTSAGARKFVVFNLPDVGRTPALSPPYVNASLSTPLKAFTNTSTLQLNADIAALIQSFPSSHPGVTSSLYDFNSLFIDLLTNPSKFGLTNVSGPCYMAHDTNEMVTGSFSEPVCPQPNSHLFWDLVHPTKHVHSIIAQDFVSQFQSQLSAF